MHIGHEENLIALSAEFHTHKAYSAFYKRKADVVGGFVGIYDVIAKMGAALTAWEASETDCYIDNGIDWVELTELYAADFIRESIDDDNHDFIADPVAVLKKTIARMRSDLRADHATTTN